MSGLASAAGYPSYGGVLAPTVWSGKLLVEFYQATALSKITNTDYEGDIKSQGDKVVIRTLPNIEVYNYVKGQQLNTQAPAPDTINLNIDQGKYWNFTTDSVDRYQSDMAYVDQWTKHAGEKVVRKVEIDVYANSYANAATANQGNTAGVISGNIRLGAVGAQANHVGLTAGASGSSNKINILEFLVNCGQVLDENDVPEDGRFILLPAFATAMIKLSDLKAVNISGDTTSPLRDGHLGTVDRFSVYQSNLLTTVADSSFNVTHAIFGHQSAITWAAQFTENDVIKSEQTFGWKYRGLNVYGFQTVKAQGLGHAVIRKTAAGDT